MLICEVEIRIIGVVRITWMYMLKFEHGGSCL